MTLITVDGHVIEYRLERRGAAAVLILHGGHMSARCRFGEETFLDAGYSVLVISRPGYGRTAAGAGPSAPEFAIRLASLCQRLGLSEVSIVGISLGARTALTMAAFYSELVPRVILMCPTSFGPWPDRRGRRIAYAVFPPGIERATWGTLHRLLRASTMPNTLPPPCATQRWWKSIHRLTCCGLAKDPIAPRRRSIPSSLPNGGSVEEWLARSSVV
jgi:pimeloyl-ACP methyl ester carboxylesterase